MRHKVEFFVGGCIIVYSILNALKYDTDQAMTLSVIGCGVGLLLLRRTD